jgi:hypothetical protein
MESRDGHVILRPEGPPRPVEADEGPGGFTGRKPHRVQLAEQPGIATHSRPECGGGNPENDRIALAACCGGLLLLLP